jgi:hypothetical protein
MTCGLCGGTRVYRVTGTDGRVRTWACDECSPGAAPATRGAAPNVCRFCGFVWGTYDPDDPCPGPICAERARGDETAPAGPLVVSGQMNDTPETRELVAAAAGMLASSPPPSGGAPKTCACGDSSAQGGHNFAGGPCVNQILRAPAPALSETPATPGPSVECHAEGCGWRWPKGDPRGCPTHGLGAPAAPSGAGDATRCACHDDGPPMDDGRCATCLLPRAPSPQGEPMTGPEYALRLREVEEELERVREECEARGRALNDLEPHRVHIELLLKQRDSLTEANGQANARAEAAEKERDEAERAADSMGEIIASAYEESGMERGKHSLPSVVMHLRQRAEAAEEARERAEAALRNLLDKMDAHGSPQGICVRLAVKRARAFLAAPVSKGGAAPVADPVTQSGPTACDWEKAKNATVTGHELWTVSRDLHVGCGPGCRYAPAPDCSGEDHDATAPHPCPTRKP